MWQTNFYGNADRECIMRFNCLCFRFLEENECEKTAFDDFCEKCLYYAIKSVSIYFIFCFRKKNAVKSFLL